MNYFDILKRIAKTLDSIDKSLKDAVTLLLLIKKNTENLNYYEDE